MKQKSRKLVGGYILQQKLRQTNCQQKWKAAHKACPEKFIIRVISLDILKKNQNQQFLTKKFTQITKIQSVHVVRHVEIMRSTNNVYIVDEFCNQGTLLHKLKKGQSSKCQISKIIIKLIQIFKILDQSNIIHGNLKMQSIFFHDGVTKLGNFQFLNQLENDYVGHYHKAPEVLKGEQVSTKSDVWSMGILIFQMFFGYFPFSASSLSSYISLIESKDFSIPEGFEVPKKICLLIERMLVRNQKERISWEQLFQMRMSLLDQNDDS